MLLAKLFKHLVTLSSEEERLFLRWLQSPFLNGNRTLISMFSYMRKSSPEYVGRRLQAQQIYKALYPEKQYKEIRIKQLGVELLDQLYSFWLHQEQSHSKTENELKLWSKLHANGLLASADRIRNKCEKTLFTSRWDCDTDNLFRYRFAKQQHQNILDIGNRDQEPKLQEVNDALDRHYYYEKLKHYCRSLIQRRFTTMQYEFSLVDEILVCIQADQYQSLPGLQYYGFAAKALREEHDPSYFKMKEILFEQHKLIAEKELPGLLLVARNYCIQRLNNRERSFLEELFSIYELEINLGLIAVDGQIPSATYKNIATLSLLLKRYDWLEQFLHKFRDVVEQRNYFFNLGVLRFTQANFEEASELFAKADYKEVLMSLSSKTWQLKTYFELWLKHPENYGYEEKLEAHLIAFTTFLNRKKASLPKHYMYHLNFGNFVRELLRNSRPYSRDKAELDKLLQRVEANDQLADRGWLLAKLKLLSGREHK